MTRFLSLILSIPFIWSCSNNEEYTPPLNEPQIEFIKTLGGSKNESGQSVIATQNGGYAIVGYTQSIDGDIIDKLDENFDYWILKYDTNDNLEWSKTFGGSENESAFKGIQTNDGGFALIGHSSSNNGDVSANKGNYDFWVVKLDINGNLIWEKSHGFSGSDQGFGILQTSDNGYLINGTLDVSASNGGGNDKNFKKHAGGDYWAIKLDASGNKEWRNYYGGTFTDIAYDAVETNNDGFLLVGSSDSNDVDISANKGSYDFWVVKIDTLGNLVWEKSYGGTEIDEAHSISKTTDGNYLIIGDSRSNNQDISNNKGAADIWLVKISPEGNLLWDKSFGGSNFDAGRSSFPTRDGGFLITGSSRSQNGDFINNNGQNDAVIIKINSDGNIIWQKTVGGSQIDVTYGIAELNNGSIIAVGDTTSNDIDINGNKGFTDLLIIKIK
jgi:hypothetical protein